MVEAGVNEYALFDFHDRGEWVVTAIYRAMARAAASTKTGNGTSARASSIPQ